MLANIESIQKEIRISPAGQATVSIRGAARIVGLSMQALSKSLKLSDNLEPSELAKRLIEKGFQGDNLTAFSKSGIPDIALAFIVEYYAFDAGRYCTEQALHLYRSFAAIGLRTCLQQAVGWQVEPVVPQVPIGETKALPYPGITLRSRIIRAVDNYVALFSANHGQVWAAIYRELKYAYHYDASARLKASGGKHSKLEQVEFDGKLEEMRSVAQKVLHAEI